MERTVIALKKKNVSVGEGVKSSTYVRVKSETDNQEGNLRPLNVFKMIPISQPSEFSVSFLTREDIFGPK